MTLLYRVIYAAHANGSHHKLALDALLQLDRPDAEDWRRLFLQHAALFLKGSKAPDNDFKDFKNHVLHVHDGFWGGAVTETQAWYARLVAALRANDWPVAVYSAGVLSHYFVDPIHPFHTGQSEAEGNIHRAVEWSISKSYNTLKGFPAAANAPHAQPLTQSPDWLADAVRTNAQHANTFYDTLMTHFDFDKGVKVPETGLDTVAQNAVAGLIAYASGSFAQVLDRAFAEAKVSPPEVSLTVETVLAMLAVPSKWILNKLADRQDRLLVEAMYAELKTTGKVDQTLTEDDRTIRDLHAAEVVSQIAARARVMPAVPSTIAERTPTPPPVAARPSSVASTVLQVPQAPIPAAAPPASSLSRETIAAEKPMPSPTPIAAAATASALPPRITAADPVEAAPSIGPKTAERLAKVGILTVADLIARGPGDIAKSLATRHITASLVHDWQDQTRLAMMLPNLNSLNASLLVEAGFRSLDALSLTDARQLHKTVGKFATTPQGARILRNAAPPSLADITVWHDAARRLSARAA